MVNWDDIAVEEVLPGICRQTLHGEMQTVVRYVYQPGAVFPVHQHIAEQVTLVTVGTIAFSVDGEELILGPGEVAVIGSNIPHGAQVIGVEVVESLNVMSPRRNESPFGNQRNETNA